MNPLTDLEAGWIQSLERDLQGEAAAVLPEAAVVLSVEGGGCAEEPAGLVGVACGDVGVADVVALAVAGLVVAVEDIAFEIPRGGQGLLADEAEAVVLAVFGADVLVRSEFEASPAAADAGAQRERVGDHFAYEHVVVLLSFVAVTVEGESGGALELPLRDEAGIDLDDALPQVHHVCISVIGLEMHIGEVFRTREFEFRRVGHAVGNRDFANGYRTRRFEDFAEGVVDREFAGAERAREVDLRGHLSFDTAEELVAAEVSVIFFSTSELDSSA